MAQTSPSDKSPDRPQLDLKTPPDNPDKPRECILNAFNKILREINIEKKVKERHVINLDESKLSEENQKEDAENKICENSQGAKKQTIKRPTDQTALENFYIEISFADLQQLEEGQLANFVQKRERNRSLNELADNHTKGYKSSKKCEYSDSQIAQPVIEQSKQTIRAPDTAKSKNVKKSAKSSKYSLQDEEEEEFTFNHQPIQLEPQPQKAERQQQSKRISRKSGKAKFEQNLPPLEEVAPVIIIYQDQSIETDIAAQKAKLGKKSTKIQTKPTPPPLQILSKAQPRLLKQETFIIEITESKEQESRKPLSRLSKYSEINKGSKEQQNRAATQRKNQLEYEPYLVTSDTEVPQKRGSFLLGKATLPQLVQQLFAKKLINCTHYYEFQENHSTPQIHSYLQKFDAGKLHEYCFGKIKFTPLDHRRISQLLNNLYPEQYQMSPIQSTNVKLLQFLLSLYDLEAEDYYHLWVCIDKISKIKWWSKILITQDQKLMQHNKERRVARRRAEQAAAAVHSVMESVQLMQKNLEQVTHPKRTIAQVYQIDDDPDPILSKSARDKLYSQQRQRLAEKQKEITEISKIRNMVSNFSTGQKGEGESKQVRKKVKFA